MLATTIIVSAKALNFSERAIDGPQDCGGLYYFFMIVYLIGAGIVVKVMIDNSAET